MARWEVTVCAALAVYSLRHVAALWVVPVSNMLRSEGKCGSLGGHSSRHVLRFVGQQSRGHMISSQRAAEACGLLWHAVACWEATVHGMLRVWMYTI